MKKNTIFNKITTVLIISSMSVILFAGCSSTKASTSTTSGITNSQPKQFDGAAIKTLYTTALKDLVTANTITQAQSDKVLEVVSKDMPQGGGDNKPTGTTNETPPAKTDDTTKGTATDKPDGSQPKNDRLSELVTSKVITQAQADTINEKISASMGNNQPNQN